MNALQTWKIWVLATVMSFGILTASVATMPQLAAAADSESATAVASSSSEAESSSTTKEDGEASASSSTATSSSASKAAEPSSSSAVESAPVSSSQSADQQVEGTPLVIDETTVIEESQVWTGGMVRIVGDGCIVVPDGVELTLDSVDVDLSDFGAKGFAFEVKKGGKLILGGTTVVSGFTADKDAKTADEDADASAEETGIFKVDKQGTLVFADDLSIEDNVATADNSNLVVNDGELDVVGEDVNVENNTTDPEGQTETINVADLISEESEGEIEVMASLATDTEGATEPEATEPESESSSSSEAATDTVTVSGTITWDDNDGKDNMRTGITVALLAGGEATSTTLDLEAGANSYEFADLPKTGSDGKDITYSVALTKGPAHYKDTVDSNGNITLSYSTMTIDVAVQWQDVNNAAKKRPQTVTITLNTVTKDSTTGKETLTPVKVDGQDATLVLDEKSSWKGTFTDVPRYGEQGEDLTYTVTENAIEGYTARIVSTEKSDKSGYNFTAINTHGTSSVTATVSTIAKTGVATTSGTGKSLAATGDGFNFLLVAGVLIAAMTAAGVALTRRRAE